MTSTAVDYQRFAAAAPCTMQAAALELASAHCYAADFGTVLEWCTQRTDELFIGRPYLVGRKLTPWDEAAIAYRLVRDARQTERRLGGEAA